MRVVIIGGTGHIGTYLTPRLVQEGHTAVCVCRRQSQPYQSNGFWEQVQFAVMDRQAEEAAGTFGKRVAELEPDAVIDLTCYTVESASQLGGGAARANSPLPPLRHHLGARSERSGADHGRATAPPVRRLRLPKGRH